MNVSIIRELADYIRQKVKSGRYNNASEVVRGALRLIEGEGNRAFLSKTCGRGSSHRSYRTAARHVLASIEDIEASKFIEHEGREGLKKLVGG